MKHNLKLGLQPFWFWNGDMHPEEIKRQIREMKEKGIPGFMIHPRQGMEVPYMSKAFFDRVRVAVQAAKENDMEVWLYDEYPYPSGICGGEVILEHPEFLSKRLEKQTVTVQGGQEIKLYAPWGKVLLARAYRMRDEVYDLDDYVDLQDCVGTGYAQEVFQYSGLTEYNKKRYFTGDPVKFLDWEAPEGTWKIWFITETVTKHFKYFENFIDTMNPEAIRYFIELTHERYKREIGEEFGKTVKGIFTDEITAFPDTQPWSSLLPGEVMKRHGVDLISNLPALWEDFGEHSAKVRYAYRNTSTDCFIEAYDKQVCEWCEANGLLYIGEKPILRSKQLQYFHVPGIDGGHQKVGSVARMLPGKYRANGKMVASAAHFYNKPAALCEVGHSIGWGMTMQDMKWILDWLAVVGIDFFVVHGFFYTADALKKHDAPPSAFYQMPWWEDAGALTEYAKQLGAFLQSAERCVKLLVVDPVTSAWTSDRPVKQRLEEDFGALQTQLMCHGLDYYIIDPELLAKGTVDSRHGQPVFVIGEEAYEALVLPPMRNLEKGALEKLLDFARAGGKICGLYTVPFEEIEEGSSVKEVQGVFAVDAEARWTAYVNGETMESVTAGNCHLAKDTESAVRFLAKQAEADWLLAVCDDLGREGLPSMCAKGKDGQSRFFVVNTTANDRKLKVRYPDGRTETLTLAPYESTVLESAVTGEITGAVAEKPDCEALCRRTAEDLEAGYYEIDMNREMPFTLSNPNSIRLGFWEMCLADGQTAVVEAAPLIDQLETGGFSYPVVQKKYFGCPKELAFTGGKAEYRIRFLREESGLRKQVYLVMEPGTFVGEWQISVNGHTITEKDFVRRHIYQPSNLAVQVEDYLCLGENEIKVSVETPVSYGGMRNPLYLFGDFGVEKKQVDGNDMWCMTNVKTKGTPEDYRKLGLPFYYGEVVFEGEAVRLGEKALQEAATRQQEGFVTVKLAAEWLADSVRLSVEDYETEPCGWSPYVFRIPARYMTGERNAVRIQVRNTALGLYEGQYFNREAHRYENQ